MSFESGYGLNGIHKYVYLGQENTGVYATLKGKKKISLAFLTSHMSIE